MDKISIIIPIYNSERYIEKCLDSVTAQTFRNLEILCINDGSVDGSGNICARYAEKDKRIKVFHKIHEGVSAAKNFGLRYVTGKYIGFVDSDDWIEPEFYDVLHRKMKANNVPIGVTGYYKDTACESISVSNRKIIPDSVISQEKMLLYPLQRDDYMGFCGYLCNKLFLAEILLNYGIRFDSDINYGEDVLLYMQTVLAGACTGIYIERPLYHYYQHDISITKNKSLRVKSDILIVYKRVEELLKIHGYEHISFWARGFYCHHASVVARLAQETHDMDCYSLMQKEIKVHLNDYIKTNVGYPEKFEKMYQLLP